MNSDQRVRNSIYSQLFPTFFIHFLLTKMAGSHADLLSHPLQMQMMDLFRNAVQNPKHESIQHHSSSQYPQRPGDKDFRAM
jgi:hypothetical protein